jgi:hypothetical protein
VDDRVPRDDGDLVGLNGGHQLLVPGRRFPLYGLMSLSVWAAVTSHPSRPLMAMQSSR